MSLNYIENEKMQKNREGCLYVLLTGNLPFR